NSSGTLRRPRAAPLPYTTLFRSLTRFAAKLQDFDLASGRQLRIDPGDETPELTALADAFNQMLARLRAERRAGARAALLAQERRSEEHTSGLQSRENLVCRLLLE